MLDISITYAGTPVYSWNAPLTFAPGQTPHGLMRDTIAHLDPFQRKDGSVSDGSEADLNSLPSWTTDHDAVWDMVESWNDRKDSL